MPCIRQGLKPWRIRFISIPLHRQKAIKTYEELFHTYWLAPMVGSISGLTIRMEFMPLLLSLAIVLAVNLLTAFFQSWCAATENLVNSIKNE